MRLTVYDNSVYNFIDKGHNTRILKKDCGFSEGPVWNSEGFYLFSDIPKNVIYKIDSSGNAEVYIDNSGCTQGNHRPLSEQIGSNGLAYDAEGNLFVCQHGNGAIAVYDKTFLKPHITQYNNKPFNSPNDVVVHPDGTLYFSDPPYGLKNQKLVPEKYQPIAGFYAYRHGDLKMFCDKYQYPNGVCLSPDKKWLYTCSNKPFEAFVLRYDAYSLQLQNQVCAEASDGIKCDRFGNLYLCTKEGIFIIGEDGKRMALIELDTVPANCCWGGSTGNDLFITARQNIFLIEGLQKA